MSEYSLPKPSTSGVLPTPTKEPSERLMTFPTLFESKLHIMEKGTFSRFYNKKGLIACYRLSSKVNILIAVFATQC